MNVEKIIILCNCVTAACDVNAAIENGCFELSALVHMNVGHMPLPGH